MNLYDFVETKSTGEVLQISKVCLDGSYEAVNKKGKLVFIAPDSISRGPLQTFLITDISNIKPTQERIDEFMLL